MFEVGVIVLAHASVNAGIGHLVVFQAPASSAEFVPPALVTDWQLMWRTHANSDPVGIHCNLAIEAMYNNLSPSLLPVLADIQFEWFMQITVLVSIPYYFNDPVSLVICSSGVQCMGRWVVDAHTALE